MGIWGDPENGRRVGLELFRNGRSVIELSRIGYNLDITSLVLFSEAKMTERTTVAIALGIAWLFWFLFFLFLGV